MNAKGRQHRGDGRPSQIRQTLAVEIEHANLVNGEIVSKFEDFTRIAWGPREGWGRR